MTPDCFHVVCFLCVCRNLLRQSVKRSNNLITIWRICRANITISLLYQCKTNTLAVTLYIDLSSNNPKWSCALDLLKKKKGCDTIYRHTVHSRILNLSSMREIVGFFLGLFIYLFWHSQSLVLFSQQNQPNSWWELLVQLFELWGTDAPPGECAFVSVPLCLSP